MGITNFLGYVPNTVLEKFKDPNFFPFYGCNFLMTELGKQKFFIFYIQPQIPPRIKGRARKKSLKDTEISPVLVVGHFL